MKSLLHLLSFVSIFTLSPAQGPLTPPPGADPTIGPVNALTAGGLPQPTMKTLHQVEPRTAIPGGTAGVIISTSGAYYLAGNITVATGDGITINASNVTLDLNGFSITTSANPAGGNGIRLGQGLRNVAIRNGNIGGDGLGGAFTGGLLYVVSGFPQPPQNLRVADLSVAAAEFGISTSNTVATCHVERCLVVGGSVHGIQGGIVKDCVVEGGPIFGRIVKDCSVTTSGTGGIVAEVVENCCATSAGTAIQAKCLVNSYGTGGGSSDVIFASVAHNAIAEGGGGSGDGIESIVVSNSIGRRQNDLSGQSQGDGIRANIVHSSLASSVRGFGIRADLIQLSQGVSSFTTGLSAEVVAFSRSAGSGGVGIAGGNVFGSSAAGNGTQADLFDGNGIQASVVAFSSGSQNGGNGIVSSNAFGCLSDGNNKRGIYSALIGASRAGQNELGGLASDGGAVSHSIAVQNTGFGVEGGTVTGVWAWENDAGGIVSSGTVSSSLADQNTGTGVTCLVVNGSVARGNSQAGFFGVNTGSGYDEVQTLVAAHSVSADNSGHGMSAQAGSSLGSMFSSNGGAGVNFSTRGVITSSMAWENTGLGLVAGAGVVMGNLSTGHSIDSGGVFVFSGNYGEDPNNRLLRTLCNGQSPVGFSTTSLPDK